MSKVKRAVHCARASKVASAVSGGSRDVGGSDDTDEHLSTLSAPRL